MRLKRAKETKNSLVADQAGATMVMGVFVAALLVGMIYYVWGIGDAIMFRERMQDASDTAAFSAAVVHARGMNMIALINMIMAALAIVAATMATISAMLSYAFGLAAAVCAGCGPWCGWCCGQCRYAWAHYREWNSADSRSDRVTDAVTPLMRGLRGYAIGIRYGAPLAAQAKVVSYGVDVYSPVTDFGIMAPPHRLELPVQDDETNWPCDEMVRPWVMGLSGPGTLISGTWSIYLLGGIAMGYAFDDPRRFSREWCEDGYFQRITDEAQEMGNLEYQVQAYMMGDHDLEWTQEGVATAAWGQGADEGSTYTALAEMGRVSFAQAEFFYDDSEGEWQEWLWHMKWRARLRRWRIEASGVGGLSGLCGGACGPLESIGGGINDAVVH